MSISPIFRYFKTSPEIIRMAVMWYVRYPLSLRNVEDLLHERGVDITYETVRCWYQRFGTHFAREIRRRRVHYMRQFQHQRWHLDEVFVKVNGVRHYLWRAVDHEGEVLESYVTKRRDKKAALKFLRKALKRHGFVQEIVTDRLASYGAAMKILGNHHRRNTKRWLNNRAENSHLPFRRRERAEKVFEVQKTYKDFAVFMAQSTITLTSNVSSLPAKHLSKIVLPHFMSGNKFLRHKRTHVFTSACLSQRLLLLV